MPDSVFTQTMPLVLACGTGFCAVAGFEAGVPLFAAFESEDDGEDGVAERFLSGGAFFLFFAALLLFFVALEFSLAWSAPV